MYLSILTYPEAIDYWMVKTEFNYNKLLSLLTYKKEYGKTQAQSKNVCKQCQIEC